MKSGSNLEKVLCAGHFAVTAELGPPTGVDLELVEKKTELLRGAVDAVNVTDNQTAVVRMSSLAVSALLVRTGIEPVMQMVCRDRNRIAMQSDIIGASALGVRNLTCLTGDHQAFGNQTGAKKVYDIDSVQLVATVKRMRDEKRLLGSEE
ncbi:MAG TPA: methylenetetrahydrofolate reductase, partial [Spirochaetia bacterium]